MRVVSPECRVYQSFSSSVVRRRSPFPPTGGLQHSGLPTRDRPAAENRKPSVGTPRIPRCARNDGPLGMTVVPVLDRNGFRFHVVEA